MANMLLANAEKCILTAPSGGILKSIKIRVNIEPADASILIYTSPNYNPPIEIHGPRQVVDLMTNEPEIYFQRVKGAKTVQIETLGWVDDLGR